MMGLPADSPYRRMESPSLTASLVELWRKSRASASRANRRAPHERGMTIPPRTLSGAH
jgi:hypothetical protein